MLCAQSEVYQLQLVIHVYEDVLRLEVPVGLAGLVDVGDAGHDLPEEHAALRLAESAPVLYVVQHRTFMASISNRIRGRASPSCLLSMILIATLSPVWRCVATLTLVNPPVPTVS